MALTVTEMDRQQMAKIREREGFFSSELAMKLIFKVVH